MMLWSFSTNEVRSSSSSLQRRLRRSNSLLLVSELAAVSESATTTNGSYQRLSPAVWIDSGVGFLSKPSSIHVSQGQGRANAWTSKLVKLFSFKGIRGRGEMPVDGKKPPDLGASAPAGNKKKRSSWLPDPDRRWPVQGW